MPTEGEDFDAFHPGYGMSARATSYVRRHMHAKINRTKSALLGNIADVADDEGCARMYTQPMMAHDLGAALPTVKRNVQAMLRDGQIRHAPFRSYVIVGVAEHNLFECEHEECRAEARAMRQGVTSDRKKALAAARARKAREKKKRQAAQRS